MASGIDALEDVLVALIDAVGYGYSAVELVWKRVGGLWLPDLYPRPHDWLTASADRRRLELAVDGGSEPLRPFGWIVHQPKLPRAGYLARGGVFRALVWPFVYKAYAVGDFAEFLETIGLPFVIGKYGREATEDDKSKLLAAVAALSHDARALLGQTLSTQAKSTGLGSGVTDLQAEVRRMIDEAESLDALRDALLAAYGGLPTERLAEVMALGFAAADLAGRYDVEREGREGIRN